MITDSYNTSKIEAQLPMAVSCPHCESTNFIRDGKNKGLQRYKCKNCQKTFKDSTNTPTHGLHKKHKAEKYLEALRTGLSVRKSAKYAGISKNTAFAWRHKFLSSLSKMSQIKEEESVGGMAIIRTPYSAKGRQKEPEKHQQQSKTILILTDNNITIKKLQHTKSTKEASATITGAINKGFTATISDTLLTRALRKQENVKRIKGVNENKHKNRTVVFIATLEDWMCRFKGVASKYLQHYWSWFKSLQATQSLVNANQTFNIWTISSRSLKEYREITAT